MSQASEAQSFDPYAPAMREDTPVKFAQLARGCCPVAHVQSTYDFYVVSDPAYISDVMFKDTAQWTVELGPMPTEHPAEIQSPMVRDDESHLWIRRLVQRGFGSAQLARLQPEIASLADELIDTMLANPQRQGDLATDLAMPLTVRVMCIILGAPQTDWPIYKQWADSYFFAAHNQPDFTPAMSMEYAGQVAQSLFPVIEARRAFMAERNLEPSIELVGRELPDDFLSRFICDKVGDRSLADGEILSMMMATILGGSETTMALVGNLMFRLLEVPSRWEEVKADASLYEAAIEESLRLDPPVLGMMRAARHDITIDGVTIPKDCKALYNVSAVNRNAELFPDPDSFRLDRPRTQMRKHASFSGGMRLCLGAALVRMEVPIVLEKLVTRLPSLELAGPVQRAPGFNVWGPARLPVRW